MASKIASHTIPGADGLGDDAGMARKPRKSLKVERRPTFLKAWRKFRRMTLIQVSDRLLINHDHDLSDSQLSRIENNKSPYNQDLLEMLARIYGTDAESLIGRDPESKELWAVWKDMTAKQQKELADYAEFIRGKET